MFSVILIPEIILHLEIMVALFFKGNFDMKTIVYEKKLVQRRLMQITLRSSFICKHNQEILQFD